MESEEETQYNEFPSALWNTIPAPVSSLKAIYEAVHYQLRLSGVRVKSSSLAVLLQEISKKEKISKKRFLISFTHHEQDFVLHVELIRQAVLDEVRVTCSDFVFQ